MPYDMTPLTVTVIASLVIGTLAVLFVTWRNAQATGTIAQLLHRTEKLPYHGEIDPRRFSDRDRD
ncbi:MAG: hypothetical protein H0X44_06845 [Acidobacteria bacterium]|nr:hypothetical protein [Acidobacteriota bacterium]